MNGAIVINKEKGMTSRDVVNKLNKIFNTKRIGHIGTLDPMATGVLVCLIGKYTKLCNILVNHDKEYIASFKLGVLTDTLDITGNIIENKDFNVSINEIKEAINSFKGTYLQEVPIYSAIKINGKKLYDYARSNEKVELPKRNVNIYSIDLIDFKDDVVTIKTKVSKGTYIRALVRDIAEKLNTYGTLISLDRISLDKFSVKNAYSLEDISNGNYKLLKLEDLFSCKIMEINEELLFKIKNGQRLNYDYDYVLFRFNNNDVAFYQKCDKNIIKPLIIF